MLWCDVYIVYDANILHWTRLARGAAVLYTRKHFTRPLTALLYVYTTERWLMDELWNSPTRALDECVLTLAHQLNSTLDKLFNCILDGAMHTTGWCHLDRLCSNNVFIFSSTPFSQSIKLYIAAFPIECKHFVVV